MSLSEIHCLVDKIEKLEARLEAAKNCKWYLCHFPDIDKIGAAYRKRDVDEALGGNDE